MIFEPKHLLVPVAVDPDADIDLAQAAIDAATSLAIKYNSQITLMHVAEVINPGESASVDVSGEIYRTISMVLKARLARGKAKLQELQDSIAAKGLSVDSRVVDTQEPLAHIICDTARDIKADLVVIGSHGRKGIKRAFLGSVAERVVHMSPVPVLLLHSKG